MNSLASKSKYPLRSLCYASLIVMLSACSWLSGPESQSIPFVSVADSPITQISSSPYIYRLETGLSGPVYLTAILDCEQGKASLESTTRRLLIGLKNIQFQAQEESKFQGRKVLVSQVTGQMDQVQIDLILFSVPGARCITDFAAWGIAPLPSNILEKATAFIADYLDRNIEQVIEQQVS